MSDLKDQLVILGNNNPSLREHIKPVLSRLEEGSRAKAASFMRKGDPYPTASRGSRDTMNREASMVRIRKGTSLGDLFSNYIGHIAEQLKNSVDGLDEMEFELRGEEDLGFRFTKRDEDGEKITYFADISFSLAPEYININVKGARGSKNFSDKLRMFLTDPARRTVTRLSTLLGRQ